jgi:hypothetical protein
MIGVIITLIVLAIFLNKCTNQASGTELCRL